MANVETVTKVTETKLNLTTEEANALTALIAKSGYQSETHGIYEALQEAGFDGTGYKVYNTGMYQVQRA